MRLLTLAAVLAIAAAPALADTERAGTRGMMPAFDFQAADTDGDGVLSRAEFAAHVEVQIDAARGARLDRRADAIMAAGDADGDGTLTRDELRTGLAAVHEAQSQRRGEWRERHAETRAERAATRAEGERGMRGQRGMRHATMRGADRAEMIDRMFDRIDADGDGTISAEELEVAQARWQQRVERRGERRGD
jgi:Ca2+-binding EF-hand superfamily protein